MQKLGVHEKLELHELLTFKTTCLTKAQTMIPLVSDTNLKTFCSRMSTVVHKIFNSLEIYLCNFKGGLM